MTTLTDTDGSVFAYEFDAEGNRLSQSLNDCLSKRFVYDGADVLLELNPTNGVAFAWVNGPGIDQPIERLLFIDGAEHSRRVFHADALGSVAALTDEGGRTVQSYAYAAFGGLRAAAGPDRNRGTYTAREQLGDSAGWMYYRARIYSPARGRFTTPDPMGFADSPNQYPYCINNPVIYSDANGQEILSVGMLAAILLFAGTEFAIAPENECQCSNPEYASGQGMANMFSSAAVMAGSGIVVNGISRVVASGTPQFTTVTSWASKGTVPDLNPGRWVQLGEATRFNFWKTGLPGPKGCWQNKAPFLRIEKSPVPFENFITDRVPCSSLQWPKGAEKWKGFLGQRQIKP